MNEPRTLTEAIERVRDKLVLLPWTDRVVGRAHIHDVKLAGQDKAQLKPEVHIGNGEYLDCRPNDNYKSVIFFATAEKEKDDYNRLKPTGHAINHINRVTRNITLYGWVNLSLTPGYDDGTGFPELIKISVKQAVKQAYCVVSAGDWKDGQINDVFKPFVVSDLDRDYERMPFCAFRLELVLHMVETRLPQ